MTKRSAEDTLAIQAVVTAYGHAIDDRDWQAFSDLITDDAVIDYRNHDEDPPTGAGPFRGRAAILTAVSETLLDAHPVQHILVAQLIDDLSDDEVLVRAKALIPIGGLKVADVAYRITVVRTPDGWRLQDLKIRMYPRPAVSAAG